MPAEASGGSSNAANRTLSGLDDMEDIDLKNLLVISDCWLRNTRGSLRISSVPSLALINVPPFMRLKDIGTGER